MTLKQIEFYEAVCQAGNVTAAAQQLYVSRSVISRAIQELEDELDIQLFVRGRNGMELTEYGKTLRNLLSQFKGFYSALLAVLNSKLPVDWPLQIRLCTNTSSLIREAVSKGILCALLPQDFVRDWDDVAVLPFNPPQNCAVKAVWNKNLPHSSALQEFVDFLLEYFAAQGIVLPEEKIEDDEI